MAWINSISGIIEVSRISNTCTLYLKVIGVVIVVKNTPMTFKTTILTGFLPISSKNNVNFTVMVSTSEDQPLSNLIISSTGFIMVEMI